MKKSMVGFLLTLIFIITISTSGCTYVLSNNSSLVISKDGIGIATTDNSSLLSYTNKTFSKEGVSFVYPGDCYESQDTSKNDSGPSLENLVLLNSNNGYSIFVTKTAVLYSENESVEMLKNSVLDTGVTMIKENVKNINGLNIHELLFTNPDNEETLYITIVKNNVEYDIQINGDKLFERYSPVINQIETTIKIE